MHKRSLIRVCALLPLAACASSLLAANSFPDRALTLVVPFPPGGAMDLTARLVGQRMGQDLGQPVVVDNRAGAGGVIGAQYVARSAPDGYTLMISNQGPNVIRELLYDSTPYRTERDFAMVSTLTQSPLVLVVPAKSPFHTVAELVAVGKQRSQSMNFASAGVGSQSQIAGEGLNVATGNAFVHVAYGGSAKLLTALMAGEVQFAYLAAADALPRIADGSMRVLAVATSKRFAQMPTVPTLAEAGILNQDFDVWYGLMVPVRTPPEKVARLRDAVLRVMQQSELQARFREMGVEVQTSTGAEMADRFEHDRKLYRDVIEKSNIKAE